MNLHCNKSGLYLLMSESSSQPRKTKVETAYAMMHTYCRIVIVPRDISTNTVIFVMALAVESP